MIVQGLEYSISSFTISDGAFSTCFFFDTGFHGLGNIILFLYHNNKYNSSILKRDKGVLALSASMCIKRFFSTNSKVASPVSRPPSPSLSFIRERGWGYGEGSNPLGCASYEGIGISSTSDYGLEDKESEICPNWVTGFSDAESSFSLKISKKSTSKSGWSVIPEFRIELHCRDTLLLRKIQSFFGVGIISERINRNTVVYSVQSYKDIVNVILPHFDKYPLITQKKADYLLFKQAVNLLNFKAISDIEMVRQIISIRASMNWGLSDTLKTEFISVVPVSRPTVNFEGILHPNWLIGFVDGEGCFYVNTKKAKTLSGIQVIMTFSIDQHVRDEVLLTNLIDYLGCGQIEKVRTRPNQVKFVVYKFNDILNKIIPFFKSYPLQGIKAMDYKDFCAISKIMEDKSHLTPEGLKKLKSWKSGMNKGRM